MQLITNSVAPNQVRETDTAYIIENVPFVRSQELSGGYVPRQNIKETANRWGGVPATLNHPRNEYGEPVAADSQPETHLGTVTNPTFDGEFVRGNIRLDKRDLETTDGASDVEQALENGDPISVSSQYAAAPAEPGEYDGQYRDNVERIIRPDSVAILPNQPGKCSIQDGCGINPQMAANSDLTIPMTQNAKHGEDADFESGDLVRWQTQASPGTGRVNQVVTTPGESVTSEADVDNPPTREATEDEPVYKLDDWTGDGWNTGQVVKSESELIGPWDDPPDEVTANMEMDVPEKYLFDNPGEAAEAAQELGFEGAGDELIHTHGEGEETMFMPGPSHEELVETLEEMGEMSANQEFELTDVSPSDINSFTDSEWDGSGATAAMPNPSEDEDAPAVLDMAHLVRPTGEDARQEKSNWKLPFRTGPDAPANTRALVAAKAAVEGARGGVDGLSSDMEERVVERINDILVNAPDDLFGSMDSEMESDAGHMDDEMSGNVVDVVTNAVAGVLGFGSSGTPAAESERDETTAAESATETEPDMQDEDKINELAANTDFDRENLEKWDGTDCLAQLYESHIEANTMSENNDPAVTFDTEEEFEERVSEIVANREAQRKKEELATEIVANSAEYEDTDAVTEDYPTVAALETKKESLQATAPAMPGRGQQVANTGSEDEYPDMEIGGEF